MSIKEVFPDENLAQLIADKLEVSISEYIDKEDLLAIEVVDDWDRKESKITNLEGLQLLKNLHALFLRNNEIEDLTPLIDLRKIVTLDLSNNKILNVPNLSTNLKNLDLSNNQIEDASFLYLLVLLEKLNLSFNNIENISQLNFPNLNSLNLRNNNIAELPKLSNVSTLDLVNTKIRSFSPISSLSNLNKLYLGSNFDLTTLPLLSKVQCLHIGDTDCLLNFDDYLFLEYFKIFSNAEKLKFFTDYKQITDYSFIINLPNLKIIRFIDKEKNIDNTVKHKRGELKKCF